MRKTEGGDIRQGAAAESDVQTAGDYGKMGSRDEEGMDDEGGRGLK